MKTKKEVQRAFGLADPPSDKFMALLAELGEGDVVTGVQPVDAPGYSAAEFAEEFAEAVIADSVGDLLAKARKESGRSLRDVGVRVGVSHARVREIEHSSNVEVATLVRFADAMGYGVKIVLEPQPKRGIAKLKRGRKLVTELQAD